ncbi:MAG: tetratricopeptide repeat protein [Ekhidna sp.]|nr:tetratricopeptide repeat protein [Ekhidna sp.]
MKTTSFAVSILLFSFILIAQDQDKILIANEYYQQGDFEKAKTLYEELSRSPQNVQLIAANYLSLLKSNQNFKAAEQFLEKSIRRFPNNMQYVANLSGIYHASGDFEKVKNFLSRFKKDLGKNPFLLSTLAQYLANERLYESSIEFFNLSRELRGNKTLYALELATIHRMRNDKASMIEEYLNYASDSPDRLNYVKNLLQDFIKEKEDLNQLEAGLLRKIQEYPDDVKYPELLIWVELQRKNFYGAFIQARSIDKRNQKPGDRTMSIGRIALDNRAFDDAEDIFAYVARQYPEGRNYSLAKKLWIESREKKIKNTYPIDKEQIYSLAQQYFLLYQELYPSQTAFEAFRSKALLHAFYLDEIEMASDILNQLVAEQRIGKLLKSRIKLDLGDIYLLKDEPWEATLLYSQVEKENPNHQLAYDAKLRNARLNYFTGNFALAKGHLDILKKNTTRDISNDAISLGMLISDNTALDTTDRVMQEFADVELLIFQNKKRQAKNELEKMLIEYQHHPIVDEVCLLLSKLALELGNETEAIDYLDQILAAYKYDILSDDAAFKKAEIYDYNLQDTEKAKRLYQEFLVEYPGSMYVAEARKRFRFLRGDLIN